MHYIQKHILDELRKSDTKRYAQLNRIGIESGHFRYHLGQLIKDSLVIQLERGLYKLAPAGLGHVDKLSRGKTTLTQMPKVITYTLLQDGDLIFLQRKTKEPYRDLLNMVGGKLHEGETAGQAATREVREKAGLNVKEVLQKGVFEVLIHKSENLLSHVVAFVFVASIDSKSHNLELLEPIKIDELSSTDGLAPDFMPIFKAITNRRPVSTTVIEVSI